VAGNLSNYLENKLLDHSLGVASYPAPAAIYAALYTVAPTDGTSGTEVPVGNGYAREQVAWNAASNGAATNSNTVTFSATGSWGTVVAVGLLDSSTGGNLLWYGNLGTPRTIGDTDDLEIVAGALTNTLD
jgi:hypothetical protein